MTETVVAVPLRETLIIELSPPATHRPSPSPQSSARSLQQRQPELTGATGLTVKQQIDQ